MVYVSIGPAGASPSGFRTTTGQSTPLLRRANLRLLGFEPDDYRANRAN